MFGPQILQRTISAHRYRDNFGNTWQYHPRSDHHSKVACWGILFDVLIESSLLRRHAEEGIVAFGINHEMRDFEMDREKDLDLVLCTPREQPDENGRAFSDLASRYEIQLTAEESRALASLPRLPEAPVGSVRLALEAKACMTEHGKAIPRLHDELNSSHLAVHGSADSAIAVGYVMINASERFASPLRNKERVTSRTREISRHAQPKAATRVIEKIRCLPRRATLGIRGFDALGITILDCCNDGSPIEIIDDAPFSPSPGDVYHYGQMIRRIAELYGQRFGRH